MSDTVGVIERVVATVTAVSIRGIATAVVHETRATVTAVAVQGPAGPPGPPGAAQRYEHRQMQAAAVWTIPHNLGARPHVSVVTDGGVTTLSGVVHLSENTLQVVLDDPQSGSAICT